MMPTQILYPESGDGDYNPDHHAPIKRVRCLATAWFDNDPMPAVCNREHGHGGGHQAAVRSQNLAPAWVDDVPQEAS